MPMRQRYGTLRQVRPGSNQPPAFTSAWLWLVATLTGVLFATGLVAVTRKVVLTHLKAAKSIEAPVQGRLSTSVPIRFAMGNRGPLELRPWYNKKVPGSLNKKGEDGVYHPQRLHAGEFASVLGAVPAVCQKALESS